MARTAKPKKEVSMEEALWKSADKLRGSVEPVEYKHVVLSLFFLKFASDKFETQRKMIAEKYGDKFVDNVAFYTKDIADSELEGINSYVEQYEEMMIGVTVRELPDGRSRCSTRTSGRISANDICAEHGGGGHFHAAVCELDEPPEKAIVIMEETCKRLLNA